MIDFRLSIFVIIEAIGMDSIPTGKCTAVGKKRLNRKEPGCTPRVCRRRGVYKEGRRNYVDGGV